MAILEWDNDQELPEAKVVLSAIGGTTIAHVAKHGEFWAPGKARDEHERISLFLFWRDRSGEIKQSINMATVDTRKLYEVLREAYGDNA